MAFPPSIALWVLIQIGIDLCLIILFIVVIRQVRAFGKRSAIPDIQEIRDTIQPVLEESRDVARQFEAQLQEKQAIIDKLNQCLDDRIGNLTGLLNRAEAGVGPEKNPGSGGACPHRDVRVIQREVIRLSEKGLTPEKIATTLGVAKGEVMLVLNLRNEAAKAQTR